MTTRNDLKEWFEIGESNGATHMIVVCDTFDHEDYPMYVPKEMDIHKAIASYDGVNMQKIMEVYKISLGWEAQSTNRVRNV